MFYQNLILVSIHNLKKIIMKLKKALKVKEISYVLKFFTSKYNLVRRKRRKPSKLQNIKRFPLVVKRQTLGCLFGSAGLRGLFVR